MTQKLPVEEARDNAIQAIQDMRVDAEVWGGIPDTFNIEFFYPRSEGKIQYIQVGLCDVRADDSLRISYDFDRDGYKIEQSFFIEKDKGSYIDQKTQWKEVGFFPAWNLEHLNQELDGSAPL